MSDIKKHLEKAEKCLQKGKSEDALKEYFSALELDPGNDTVRQNAADLAFLLQHNREAEVLLAPLFDRFYWRGEVAKALSVYRKLIKVGEPKPLQTFQYGQLVERGSNRKQALDPYETALGGFLGQGLKKEGFECLKRIVTLDPTARNFHRAAELALELQQPALAASYLRSAGALEVQEGGSGLQVLERAYLLDKSDQSGGLLYATALLAAGKRAAAAGVLEGFADQPRTDPAFTQVYVRVLIESKRPAEAYPLLWKEFEADPRKAPEILNLIRLFFESGEHVQAVTIARKLQDFEERQGRRKEFVDKIRRFAADTPSNIPWVEYLCDLYNGSNLEHEYCQSLSQLFRLHYTAGNFAAAADALDASVHADPYDADHMKYLQQLQGKTPDARLRSIRAQIQGSVPVVEATAPMSGSDNPPDTNKNPVENSKDEPTLLEDFILQAEIFLQYSLRAKALERLERIAKLFPGEEQKNERLKALFLAADFAPPAVPAPPAPPAAAKAPPTAPVASESAFDFERITEITRNLQRQSNVKAVLFAAVNDAGRLWNAGRCVAGLCVPGERPSAALEYCARGVPQSSSSSLVKLITELQVQAQLRGAIIFEDAPRAAELQGIRESILLLGIKSLLAVPLTNGESQSGMLILQQCDTTRVWRSVDVMAAKAIADQITLAINNLKLRSLMKSLAITDEDSGLVKRSSYLDVLLSEIGRAMRQRSATTVMLMTFDESLGHKGLGPSQLETAMDQIARTLLPHTRQNDVAVRYGQTAIALILAGANAKSAFQVHDKMRKVIRGIKLAGMDCEVDMHAGIAEALLNLEFDPADIVTELINRVESALMEARKNAGDKAHAIAPADSSSTAALA